MRITLSQVTLVVAVACGACDPGLPNAAGSTSASLSSSPSSAAAQGSVWVAPAKISDAPRRAHEPAASCASIKIEPLTDAERSALIAELLVRNPGASLNELTPKVGFFYLSHSGAIPFEAGHEMPEDGDVAVAEAATLVRRNADLLGFTVAELETAQVTVQWDTVLAPGMWRVTMKGAVPLPGLEAYPSAAKQIGIAVTLGSRSASFTSLGEVLPPFELCAAAFTATSKEVADAVVGQEVGSVDAAGNYQSAGKVEPKDVLSVEPTVFVDRDPQTRGVIVTRAFAVRVARSTEIFYVDASSPRVIARRATARS
jgi:hypothetical protein